MGMLDHWHPMLPSKSLRRKPVGVRLAGTDIALFRTQSGHVSALNDVCPHRRMRLSVGKVVGEKLQCRYHGWTFDCAGNGESPGTPKLRACASIFDACEKYGYVWVKSKASNPVMPAFDVDGWFPMGTLDHNMKAPLELTVDNFCEIEHTPMVHEHFGYELDGMKEVSVRFETTDDTVKVINRGPMKNFNIVLRRLVGIKRDWLFHDIWTTYFSPVYAVYDHYWTDPANGNESWVKWRFYLFFTPVDANETRISSFLYSKSKWPLPGHGGLLPFRGFLRRRFSKEVGNDLSLIGGLASNETSLDGMKLSRFDKALGLNRERIERVYRGSASDGQRTYLRIAAE